MRSLAPPLPFDVWQTARRRFCHDRLKNEILNVLLAVRQPVDAAELMSAAEWGEQLQRWDGCLAKALTMILDSVTALSPARFLESGVWQALPADERQRYGDSLHGEWWERRGMAGKVDAALEATAQAGWSLVGCQRTLARAGEASERFVRAVQELAARMQAVHGALRAFDFEPGWR